MARLKNSGGFTLIEALISMAIMGFVISVLGLMLRNGYRAWNFGTANMQLSAEARTSMAALTKFIQNAQAPTIRITRFNSTQPAESYIAGKLSETVFVQVASTTACGFAGGGSNVVGSAGGDFSIYQNGHYLVARIPSMKPGAAISESAITYKAVTLSANLESFMVTFNDTGTNKSVSVGARFSKVAYKKEKPASIYLKKVIVIKHTHGSGYYGN